MSESLAAAHVPIDVELGSAFLANMLACWLDGDRESSFSLEVADEYHDQRAASEQDRLCVCAPVDDGASPSPSGEHGTPVCAERESPAIGLEQFDRSDSGPGSGQVRSADNGPRGFQDSCSGSFDGTGGRSVCAGSFATGALECSWQRLLELCALTDTLVIDEDGCYNPADFNDGLLLGLKGTMAQAELHLLRGRLLGGKLNKARTGELRFPLPVGLCYDEANLIVHASDEVVQGAVALVFRLFRETGTAFAVVQQFAKAALRFPKRSYGGAW